MIKKNKSKLFIFLKMMIVAPVALKIKKPTKNQTLWFWKCHLVLLWMILRAALKFEYKWKFRLTKNGLDLKDDHKFTFKSLDSSIETLYVIFELE